ncbi:MAG: TRAP transporter small permease [Lachnospiraceae bacterium]|nr:TRAP transporter small permease [Lachnospiraceae bacterium]MBQ9034185.1 TRAP transporter small permease [Lachnospiraceae bacterium]MBQ9049502.1 TRAP transporter small permease [Lachnospiraceae bacterium]
MEGTIERIFDKIYEFVMLLCKLLLIADVVITSYAVLGRYAGKYIPFLKDPAWSEEIVLTCMIYMAFLSAALAIRKGTHIRMTSLDPYLPPKAVIVLDLFAYVLVLLFSMVLVWEGFQFAVTIGSRATYTSLPWLSRFWLYAPVPISGIAMVMFQIDAIVKYIREKGE